ncbi:hypothetical protein BO86DRAFT_382996 [Aspergillus japonicus CBS 114.51]|uniref:Uncharacterized protein n=1 Tax=Aspergillus japonicus CBS 114.51 TaxID=1448312 RepID=A0A8T8WNX2_ASPJA|nr:hypothetical protein BO86DRAFT_382996 [Aspergillus japonicus CBS 114.51]RAH77383.1 hypothetical protein BO86DRAFT_382996 [Aspergillus japonicus CBS 114.51]
MTNSNSPYPSPSILYNNTSNKAPQKKSVKLPVLRPSPAGVRKPAARHSTPNQEPLPSTCRAVESEMRPENSYQSPYAYLAPSQQPDTRSAAAPAVASPPVTPGVSAHPAAADLIRADERLEIREELLGRGYKLPSGLLRAREQTPGTKIEDQEDEQNSRNLTLGQKLRRAELSVEIEEREVGGASGRGRRGEGDPRGRRKGVAAGQGPAARGEREGGQNCRRGTTLSRALGWFLDVEFFA